MTVVMALFDHNNNESFMGENMFKLKMILSAVLSLMLLTSVQATEKLKPFILADVVSGDMAAVVSNVKSRLTAGGFEVVGDYSPYAGATIIGVTNGDLKTAAGQTDFGVFGAAQRVSVTKGKDGKLQIAYTNPVYWANAYRMKGDLAGVAAALKQALGMKQDFGPPEGLTADKLRDYQYKWLMPYFTDRLELASYGSYDEAVKGVEAALAAGKGGVKKVWRVDLPGKQASVIGVHITEKSADECAGDKYIMERIDFKDIKSTAHLPYEMVIKGGDVYALRAEFRIAISFPDLSMMGSNSFASIMCAPGAIEETLTLAAGGEMESE